MRLIAPALCLLLITAAAGAGPLAELTTVKDSVSRRASSTDPDLENGNADARTIAPGETLVIADLEGPGVIRHIWNTVNSPEEGYSRLLALRIYWDDEVHPSVEAPLGDFFAAGHGIDRNVDSLPVQVTSEGRARNCFWAMPFRERARIEVTNEGKLTVASFYWYVNWEKVDSLPEDTAYFHAHYRQEFPAEMHSRFLIADIVGHGHYVGTVQAVRQRVPHWLGEGDDFFYLDGDTTPTLTGTGTEDYFCDAWGFREDMRPYYGVVLYEGEDVGDRTSVYRWHVADPIRFRESCRVEIEHTGPIAGESGELAYGVRPDDVSTVAFWYQVEPHQPWAPMPTGYDRTYPAEITPASFGEDVPAEYISTWVRSLLQDANMGVVPARELPEPDALHWCEIPVENPLPVTTANKVQLQGSSTVVMLKPFDLAPGAAQVVPLSVLMPRNLPRVPQPMIFEWTMEYPGPAGTMFSTTMPVRYVFDPVLEVLAAPETAAVDGDASEWAFDLALRVPAQVQLDAQLWEGLEDASAAFTIVQDAEAVYVAGTVTDDHVVEGADAPWTGDGVELRVSALPEETLVTYRGDAEFEKCLLIAMAPGEPASVFARDRLPEGIDVACAPTAEGYAFEVAIPHGVLDGMQGKAWERLRFNLCIDDTDEEGRLTQLWWRPDWRSPQTYDASGILVR